MLCSYIYMVGSGDLARRESSDQRTGSCQRNQRSSSRMRLFLDFVCLFVFIIEGLGIMNVKVTLLGTDG